MMVAMTALAGLAHAQLKVNPNQAAILRWYAANRTTAFAAGNSPWAVAFDGSSIWVSNYLSNNVTKLRASDGLNLGNFNVGTLPIGVAFDGANIWVANSGSNTVSKLRASDGALQGTFAVGSAPLDLAFDGANIWVTNGDNTVSKL
jgi:DNA-binding beta-propeller fold protein YncE